jgi:hypothetical protein
VRPRTVSYEQLLAISACVALALLPRLGSLPPWVLVAVAVLGGIRLALARRGGAAPPRGARLLIAGLAIGMLFLQFHL